MAWRLIERRWRAAVAAFFTLAMAAPATAHAQQPPAPAQHGYLGAELRSLTREETQTLRLSAPGGAAVTKVETDSPAGSAGLRRGDILVEIDGKPVASAAQVLKLIAGKTPGTAVALRVLRQGRLRAGPVKLGAKPDEQVAAAIVAAKPEEPAAAAALAAGEVPAPAQQRQDAPTAERGTDPVADRAPAQDKLPVEVVPQIGHTGAVHSVAFSPDGRLALSGSLDNSLKLWEVATGRELRSFNGHTNYVNSVAFSPDGRFALSGSEDTTLKLWDVATGKELRTFNGHTSYIHSVAFSPDGRLALSGGLDGMLKWWDVATGNELSSFTLGTIQSVAFSPDGRFALSGGFHGGLILWDAATRSALYAFTGHSYDVSSVAFSPDSRFALSGSGNLEQNPELKLWELATGKELRSFGNPGSTRSLAFSPDGRLAVSGGSGKLKLWDVATGNELRSFIADVLDVTSVAFSPDGRFVLSGGYTGRMWGGSTKLWEVATGKEVRSFSGRKAGITSIASSPDGRFILSGSEDSTLKLWEVATGKMLRIFSGHGDHVSSVAFSPDGRLALSGGCDDAVTGEVVYCRKGSAKLWEVATGKNLRRREETGGVTSVAFSPDGRSALSDGRPIKLWELATSKVLRTFGQGDGITQSVAFSPDGRFALSGANAIHPLQLWEVATGKEMRSFIAEPGDVRSVAFSPDGRSALSGHFSGLLTLWDMATGKELRSFAGHTRVVNSVALSPDGRLALSGSGLLGPGELKLWDVATGKELRTFNGHAGPVSSVGFSADGRLVLSGGSDGTIRIWDVEKEQNLAQMVATADGEWLTLTPDGFLTGSRRDMDVLAIVRGVESTTIGQVHQSLYNPDLVREALAGDLNGEVKRAAEAVNLEKVLDSGPAPFVEITSHPSGSKSDTDLVTVAARITDRGKGIGRIEWRVNGVTAGVMAAPAGPGPDYDVKQELALDPGENQIEVIAYEGRNLLASLPARTTIAYDGPADTREAEAAHPRHRHQRLRRRWLGAARQPVKSGDSRRSARPCRTPRLSAPKWKRPARGNMRKSALPWRWMPAPRRANWKRPSGSWPAR